MARKNLLKDVMDDDTPAAAPATPRYAKGAIGAVSKSIEDLKRRAVIDVEPNMIDAAGIKDRLDEDTELAALAHSIDTYGQQVPVLLRPNPNYPERFEIVYGRRRVAALRALGKPVKALIRLLDDRALVLAQGQENTARKDLSFIEKANFARQMRDGGYARKIICDALSMDKTLMSRLLSVADRVPLELIQAIGAAPTVGRDRWLALADAIGDLDLCDHARGDSSDARFDAVMRALRTPRPAPPEPDVITDQSGGELAQVLRKGPVTSLKIDSANAPGFDTWLIDNLPELHRQWLKLRNH
ncbi:MAG: plasmid partitioning protein RepB [Sedimentitalea sp.]